MGREPTEQELLDSAISCMKAPIKTFEVKPWRELLNRQGNSVKESTVKNVAQTDKAKEVKAAAKTVVAKGVAPYKHVPGDTLIGKKHDAEVEKVADASTGNGSSVFNQTETPAPTGKVPTKQELDEAKAKAKIAEKEAKNEAAKQAAQVAAVKKAEKDKEREARKNETAEARAKRVAELQASGRTYTGSMVALAERVKSGAYVKSALGQLRSTDELAIALDAVPPANVVALGVLIFSEPNKYGALNVGQQSMNYRNRIRGAIKKGDFKVGEEVLTLDVVKALVAAHKFAIDIVAEAAVKKALAEKTAAEKAAKAKADAEAKAVEAKKVADAKAAAVKTPPVTMTAKPATSAQAAA